MTQWLTILPAIVPIAVGILAFLAPARHSVQGGIAVAGSLVLLVLSFLLMWEVWHNGILAVQMGTWAAPFGITMVADRLGAAMVVITAIVGVAVSVYALTDIDEGRMRFGFHPMLQVLLGGVCGAFLTGDLFNLYVWFEVMLIASFALLVLGGEKAQLDGAVKYVALNLISTISFLAAIGLLYGMTGTLNMADLHLRIQEVDNDGLVAVIAVLFIVAFGIKSAMFPLFFWLPASYHTPPVAVAAVFSGLLTKVGVYALIRMFTLIFTGDTPYTHGILLVAAGLTMLSGVLGAACQSAFRRILSFHIVSQIGYMVMGLALYTPLAIAGAVFYLIHHIIVKANLFLVSGVAERVAGGDALGRIGGLYKSQPLLAVLFLIPAFSLAGFPPLSGFWAKFILVKASLEAESYAIAATALVVGLLTIFSMTKIWGEAFWKPHPDGDAAATQGGLTSRQKWQLMGPIAGLAALTVIIGLFAAPFLDYAIVSAEELMDPAPYVRAVLGGGA